MPPSSKIRLGNESVYPHETHTFDTVFPDFIWTIPENAEYIFEEPEVDLELVRSSWLYDPELDSDFQEDEPIGTRINVAPWINNNRTASWAYWKCETDDEPLDISSWNPESFPDVSDNAGKFCPGLVE